MSDHDEKTSQGDPKDLAFAELQKQYDDVLKKLEECENSLKEKEEQFLRAQADFVNFKQRAEKEKGELTRFANERFAEDLIALTDTYYQASSVVPKEIADNAWVQGILQFEKLLQKFFDDQGITQIEIVPGETEFNPELHEALSQEEGEKANVVVEVFQKGYMFHDKVLRHAKVKVST